MSGLPEGAVSAAMSGAPGRAPEPGDPWAPVPHRVVEVRRELADTVSLALVPVHPRPAAVPPRPGQFHMVWVFGVGEAPLSVSAVRHGSAGRATVLTVRAAGPVTAALCGARPGDVVGLRGPLGRPWRRPEPVGSAADEDHAQPNGCPIGTGPEGWAPPAPHAGDGSEVLPDGADVVVVAEGLGLAPLRPLIEDLLDHPGRWRRLTVVVGAAAPDRLLYRRAWPAWRQAGADVRAVVTRPGDDWAGAVGVVEELLADVVADPGRTWSFVAGSEDAIGAAADELDRLGVAPRRVEVSLERNMPCGIALCGHCQLGPLLLCRDGPVVSWDVAAPLLAVPEL